MLATARPVLRDPLHLALGAPGGEGASHLWGLVTTSRGLWTHGPFLRVSELVGAPDGVRLDLVDPLHLLLVAPLDALSRAMGAGLAGATAGWNLLHLGSLLLLAWGAWRLAARLGASPRGKALAAVGALATPYLQAGLSLGRSELLGCLLLPLLLSLLVDLLRPELSGPEPPAGAPAVSPRRAGLLAALCLAAIGLSGWQALLLCLLALVPAVLLLARGPGLATAARRLLPVGLGATALLLPMLLVHLGTDPWWTGRLAEKVSLGPDAEGSALAALLRLDGLRPAMATTVPAYPGLGLLLLALAGLVPRRTRAWAALALFLVLLAVGPRLQLPGGARADIGPAWVLVQLLPPYGGLVDWARVALVAGPLCAVVAGLLLSRARPALVAAVAALLLADGLSWRLDAPGSFDTRPPPALAQAAAALPPGPVLDLPGVMPDERDQLVHSDFSMLWALSHGHPVTAAPSPAASPMLGRSMLLQLHRVPPRRGADPCASTEGARLHALGFRSVLLDASRLPPARVNSTRQQLADILGPPAGSAGDLHWWTLQPGDPGPAHCAGPPTGTPPGPQPGPKPGPR